MLDGRPGNYLGAPIGLFYDAFNQFQLGLKDAAPVDTWLSGYMLKTLQNGIFRPFRHDHARTFRPRITDRRTSHGIRSVPSSRLHNPRIDLLVTDLQLGPAFLAIPCIFASVARPRASASDTSLLQGRRVAPSGRLGWL